MFNNLYKLIPGCVCMKKFNFRLEKVLEVREIEEEKAQNRLLQAREKVQKIKKELNELEDIQYDLYQYLREKEGLTLNENLQYREYIKNNRQQIIASENRLVNQQEKVASFQQAYIEKRRRREVLEKLKEKEYLRYYKEMLLKEQKEMDELALRFHKKGIQGV